MITLCIFYHFKKFIFQLKLIDVFYLSGVRPVATFASSSGTTGPVLAPGAGYSRESTPDSGGSHYMDPYRDPGGEYILRIIYMVLKGYGFTIFANSFNKLQF